MLNRYARMRRHKRHLKQLHANKYNRYYISADEQEEKESYRKYADEDNLWLRRFCDPRNDGYTYWCTFYISGPRKYAKSSTNRKIRSKFKSMGLKHMNAEALEDVMTMRGADYEKEFDYFWEIY